MSFGRNPHVAKAEAEELKAATAKDAKAAELAWREAARQWDRAADRETDAKRRATYAANAESARTNADAPAESEGNALEAVIAATGVKVDKLSVN
jgi:hypothetical protein